MSYHASRAKGNCNTGGTKSALTELMISESNLMIKYKQLFKRYSKCEKKINQISKGNHMRKISLIEYF